MMLMAVLTLAWGCSSEYEEISSSAPVAVKNNNFTASAETPLWSVDLKSNEPVPDWVSPDPSKFESSMFTLVKLQQELVPYASADDRMTVFINGECRAAVSVPSIADNSVYFVLKIRGNSTDRDVNFTLSYYSAQLRQTFSLTGQETFATEKTYGFDEDFCPHLLKGSSKYPVQNDVTLTLPAQVPFEKSDSDLVGAFVNGECRGVGTIGKPFTIFRTSDSETVTLRYYSSQKGGVYSLEDAVNLTGSNVSLTLKF